MAATGSRGHQVVPDGPLPMLATDIEQTVDGCLADCSIAVHLLGRHYGATPEDSAESLPALQVRLTARRGQAQGILRLIWMPGPGGSSDARQQEFLGRVQEDSSLQLGAEILEGDLNLLKKDLIRCLPPPEEKKVVPPASPKTAGTPGGGAAKLYLICDPQDETGVEALEGYLFDQGLEVCLPAFDGDDADAAALHQENLMSCDAVLVCYGAAPKAWVDIKLRELLKAAGYPTDCNLLWDAVRKCVDLIGVLHEALGLAGWRKAKYWKRQIKSAMRACERIASAGGANKEERLLKSAQDYLRVASQLDSKVNQALEELKKCVLSGTQLVSLGRIGYFHEMLVKHLDLVERRLICKETIPHEEKVCSLFETHTELIKKGKSMPPVEFGHRLLLGTEQHGLILDYKVMEGGSESAEVMPLVERVQERFGADCIASLSTDKGFSTVQTRKELEETMDQVVMPKKGRRTVADKEREQGRQWKKLKDKHSTIESDINCLEHHGLNRCPDKGFDGYKRYVGLGVLAFNLQRIGAALLSQRAQVAGRRRKKAA